MADSRSIQAQHGSVASGTLPETVATQPQEDVAQISVVIDHDNAIFRASKSVAGRQERKMQCRHEMFFKLQDFNDAFYDTPGEPVPAAAAAHMTARQKQRDQLLGVGTQFKNVGSNKSGARH
ncbi:hypothetical protein NKR23_g4870 [Pleurostoma richardsiae]|uniref:Uncharacterized protein n=1 Tax=Pleurostoma richardsiae TaxID=41990 RepID=A0AA38RF24_9PEZI|nr:hypothetical protein NKR23_g4870 [Pleurostoma richardsiae]